MLYLFTLLFFAFQPLLTDDPLFELLQQNFTGIDFKNTLIEKPGNNILETEFFYNGGDVNSDGLPDIYFTANQGSNALYLNEGNFQFKNVTSKAGVIDSDGWSAGVMMGDINGDGLPDLYVCKAGKEPEETRKNKLFIHQGLDDEGVPLFREMAEQYGLDDPGYCTQAAQIDYNLDGHLDLFIVNYNTRDFSRFDIATIRNQKDRFAGDKLYRNNGNGTFTNVSEEAEIFQYPIGFGLSATVSDLNDDGWPDIYVTNDFMERDYMYINQSDGTFKDEILTRTNVTSYFSMGSDISDIDNNGSPDIIVADMLPPGYERRSVFKTPNYSIYDRLAANGYHRKNMRNTLQINNGDGFFTEAGQLAGISATDWTWAALMADFDNDGKKDLFFTNGFPRFYTDLDYLNDTLWERFPDSNLPDNPELKYELSRKMEPVEMHNFAFKNEGAYSFRDVSEKWGLNDYSVSGGAAYADLDNDGDLDLVVNNWNETPSIYRNRLSDQNETNYLKIILAGQGANRWGVGAKIKLKAGSETFYREAYQTRGFQSSVSRVLHFGLGTHTQAELEIIWPDQSRQILTEVDVNQTMVLEQKNAASIDENTASSPLFLQLNPRAISLTESHLENVHQDRLFSPLMPYTLSNLGPALAAADVNNDGLQDLYMGGGQNQAGQIYIQQTDGTFSKTEQRYFSVHKQYDDKNALFFDADGNGTTDLYVVSGGNFDQMNSHQYQDRLYLNDGFGNFRYTEGALPKMYVSGGAVTLLDYDEDNDPDLFVGGRVLTGRYPMSPRSYLLRNDEGTFTDVTDTVAPDLKRPGMVTDAVWFDTNGDTVNELVISGEWMPIRVFEIKNHRFTEITNQAGFGKSNGLWNALSVTDVNRDGLPDLLAGNLGQNHFLYASEEHPAIIYLADFNKNGLMDPLLTYSFEGKTVPFAGRDLFLKQVSGFEEHFPTYESWANMEIQEIIKRAEKQETYSYKAYTFSSTVFINDGDGRFNPVKLPEEVQMAPVFDFFAGNFFGTDIPEILAAGNNFGTRPELGPIASEGVFFRMNENQRFEIITSKKSGFFATGDVRNIEYLPSAMGPLFILGTNGKLPRVFLFQGENE